MGTNFDIEDGTLRNTEEGTLFRSHATGQEVLFRGTRTHVGGWLVAPYGAFQLWGHIFIGRKWYQEGFCLRHYAHEYGHYMQECRLGHLRYLFRIALPSVWSVVRKPSRHAKKTFEQEATMLGRAYLRARQRNKYS